MFEVGRIHCGRRPWRLCHCTIGKSTNNVQRRPALWSNRCQYVYSIAVGLKVETRDTNSPEVVVMTTLGATSTMTLYPEFQRKRQGAWWRHQMETFFALLAICAGNSPVTGEFSTQRPVTRSFDVFFDLRLNKTLSKQWWGWWFETPPRSLWRHCNGKRKVQYLLPCHEPWHLCRNHVTEDKIYVRCKGFCLYTGGNHWINKQMV